MQTLHEIGFQGALAIEREAGDDRFGDIKMAVDHLIAVHFPVPIKEFLNVEPNNDQEFKQL